MRENPLIVLSREPGQSILIGDSIEFTVVESTCDQVRLRVTLAGTTSQDREEALHIGESMQIPGGIVITIIDIRRNRARLGIQTPPDLSIHRKEVYEAILKTRRPNNPPSDDGPSLPGIFARLKRPPGDTPEAAEPPQDDFPPKST